VAPTASPENSGSPSGESTTAGAPGASDEVFVVVEEQPSCGGVQALAEHIQYPEEAREAGIEGRVFVQFVVDENGDVVDPKVTRGVQEALDEEALAAVKQLECTPGKQRGQPVRVRMALPVTFKMPEENTATTSSTNQPEAEAGSLQSENRQMEFQELEFDGESVTGRIVDATTGQPLAGVNIVVPNTTTGSATGPDGSFTLRADASRIVASYVGYERIEAEQ
jgi:TonB family protein